MSTTTKEVTSERDAILEYLDSEGERFRRESDEAFGKGEISRATHAMIEMVALKNAIQNIREGRHLV